MPQAIAAVLVAVGVPTATAALLGTVIFYAATIAYAMQQSQKAKRKQTEAFNAAQVDRLANVVATVAPREIVLGRVRKGGPVVFRGSTGDDNETFLEHIALAAHEIDAVEAVYLNDVEVELDANGYVLDRPYLQLRRFVASTSSTPSPPAGTPVTLTLPTGLVTAPTLEALSVTAHNTNLGTDNEGAVAFTLAGNVATITDAQVGTVVFTYTYTMEVPYARVWWDLGSTSTTADARTEELFPDLWTPQHRGRGVAKLIAEFTYDETAFPSSIPLLTARIRGAKIYDPRDPAQDPDDETTWLWSENPALQARHVYQHAYFGKAAVTADEEERFIAAANACDIEQDYVVDGETETRPMFTAGTVGQFGAPAASLLDDLTQAMGGKWDFAGGEIYIRAGVYTAHVLDLDDSDLALVQRQGDSENEEQMTIAVHRERAEKFNTVNLRIWDGAQDYKGTGLPPVKSATLITRDGAELAQEITFAAVSHSAQAQHIAGIMMRDARDPLTLEAPFKMTAYPLELFDVVRLTLARYGWVNKTFMVLGRVWMHDKGVIKLTLKETNAAIFTPDATFLSQGYGRNTRLPTPWDIEPPVLTAEGVYSGTDELVQQADGSIVTRVRVTWAALTDARIASSGSIDIRWRPAASTQWQTVTVDGSATEAYIIGARDGKAIIIRARSRTSVAVSDWSDHVAHIVVGKTEDPDPVNRFKVIGQPGGIKRYSWSMTTPPLDLRSFVVRYSLGATERPWDSMFPLFSADKNARVRETAEPYGEGAYTFALRVADTTGNFSDPIYASGTFKAFGDVALLVLPYEEDWPGTKTSCFLSGTSLVDVGTATWNDIPATWNDTTTWEALWSGFAGVSPITYEHTVIDMGSSVAWTFRVDSLADGATLAEYAYSADGITYTDWLEVPDEAVTATGQHFKFRWTITGSAPALHLAQVIFYE